jgi:YfiH family protein
MDRNLREGVPFLTFEAFTQTGLVRHGFSLRDGGVSAGPYGSMNLSFTLGDPAENVSANYRRIGGALGVWPESMTSVWQAHTDRIKTVGPADAGLGVVRDKERTEWDGMITDTPGITLVTLHADCLPLFFLDPVHRAVGLVHSGWRGTCQAIGPAALSAMKQAFGTDPGDVLAGIGPGICASCFEVGEEVAEAFGNLLGVRDAAAFLAQKDGGKYLLDLAAVNRKLLLDAGIREDRLSSSGLCTRCRPDLFYSHRRDGSLRGSMAAFLALRIDGDRSP